MFSTIAEIRRELDYRAIDNIHDAIKLLQFKIADSLLQEYLIEEDPVVVTASGDLAKYSSLSLDELSLLDGTHIYDTLLMSIAIDALTDIEEGTDVNVFDLSNNLIASGIFIRSVPSSDLETVFGFLEPNKFIDFDINSNIFKLTGKSDLVNIYEVSGVEKYILVDIYRDVDDTPYIVAFDPYFIVGSDNVPGYFVLDYNNHIAFYGLSDYRIEIIDKAKLSKLAGRVSIKLLKDVTTNGAFDYDAILYVNDENGNQVDIGSVNGYKNLAKASPNSKHRSVLRWERNIELNETKYTKGVKDSIDNFNRYNIVNFINNFVKEPYEII